MKKLILTLMLLVTFAATARRVFVLTVDEEIDATAWRHTSRAIGEATADGAGIDLFVLKLNTYGGAVDMADSIRTALMRLDIPTAAYIDHNAASAGALIALACDTVIMAPHATMGAASVVNGNGEIMPPKFQSYWSSIMRATAMSHGKYIPEGDSTARWRRDPAIAADMVNPEKAISLTADEAVGCGMADGVADNLSGALDLLGISPEAEVIHYVPTTADRILGFLASAAVRAILITLILGGLYMEMHTPGLGFAAAVAIVAAILYFLPMIATGSMAAWVIILFIIGIVLLALEIFVVPGFGITGISGILCIIASLLGAIINADGLAVDAQSIGRACGTVTAGILIAGALVWLLTSRFGPRRLRRAAELTREQKTADGYIGVDTAPAAIVGHTGVAVTDLRPSGKVEVDGTTYDASSTGAFIEARSHVRVVRFEAAQIYVEKSKKSDNQ